MGNETFYGDGLSVNLVLEREKQVFNVHAITQNGRHVSYVVV